jgi:hypothetical protein
MSRVDRERVIEIMGNAGANCGCFIDEEMVLERLVEHLVMELPDLLRGENAKELMDIIGDTDMCRALAEGFAVDIIESLEHSLFYELVENVVCLAQDEVSGRPDLAPMVKADMRHRDIDSILHDEWLHSEEQAWHDENWRKEDDNYPPPEGIWAHFPLLHDIRVGNIRCVEHRLQAGADPNEVAEFCLSKRKEYSLRPPSTA